MNRSKRMQKRTSSKKILTALSTALLLLLVPMAAPALAGQGNPPSVECGVLDPLYNKFQINNGEVGQSEVSTPPGEIIELTVNEDGTFHYELTDDDYIITKIVLKSGQTPDVVLIAPAAEGDFEAPDDISHITFCFATAPPPPPTPVAVDVDVLPCEEGDETTPVLFTIPGGNATITITQDGEVIDTVTSTDTLELPAGDYDWSAEADDGFAIDGDDSGSFTVEDCDDPPPPPTPVAVDVDVLPCEEGDETTPVLFTIPGGNATITITQDGEVIDTVNSSGTIELPAGDYDWSAEAADGFDIDGDDSGTFTVSECDVPSTPDTARVAVDLGACDFDETSQTPVTVVISPAGGATVTLSDEDGELAGFSGDGGSAVLLPGTYTFEAIAADGFELTGATTGTLEVEDCEPEVLGEIETRGETLARTGSVGVRTLTLTGLLVLIMGMLLFIAGKFRRLSLAVTAESAGFGSLGDTFWYCRDIVPTRGHRHRFRSRSP